MDDRALYARWQEMFSELIEELGNRYDPRVIYEYSSPLFFAHESERVNDPFNLALGLSRLEWLPDLPRGVEWPHYGGRAMEFIGQINLADLDMDFHPLIPTRGWLYFFIGDFWDQDFIPHRVLYFDGPITELERAVPLANLRQPDQLRDDTALLSFQSGFFLDASFEDSFHYYNFGHKPENAVLAEIKTPICSFLDGAPVRVGGFTTGIHGGGEDNYALKYLCGTDNIRDIPDGRAKPIEMLFSVDSMMGRCWGDVGYLDFFIRKDDLENRYFDNTYCEVIST